MQENKPVLIVGLGNPGAKYAMTRHNVGFMAADSLAGSDAKWKSEKNALTYSINTSGHKVIIAKPQTFMNRSGDAVLGLMTFYKIPLENLVVIHDDMDLKLGDVREKVGGGSAGHNGIKSIDANIGRDYLRIRIGVGHPTRGAAGPRDTESKMDPSDWVLGKFTDDEIKEIKKTIDGIKI